jgi:hypothetical protein
MATARLVKPTNLAEKEFKVYVKKGPAVGGEETCGELDVCKNIKECLSISLYIKYSKSKFES